MILSPMNVELTKVHYYESFRKHRNSLFVNSEVFDNTVNINIKRNIFGQKSWTFKVNNTNVNPNPKFKQKQWNYKQLIVVFIICLFLALISAGIFTVIYLHNSSKQIRIFNSNIIPSTFNNNNSTRIVVYDQSELLNVEAVLKRQRNLQNLHKNKQNVYKTFICNCKLGEVCMQERKGTPLCIKAKDGRDPTGCGGHCKFNTQHCRILDKNLKVYECAENKIGLRCPLGYFNCANRLCLHSSHVCDGIMDCLDLSDEKNCSCNLTTHFQCGEATSCFANWQRCDGKVDCWDTSDEKDCPKRVNCPTGQLSCGNSTQCFEKSQFCDGKSDCDDHSDEICFQTKYVIKIDDEFYQLEPFDITK